MNNHEMIFSYKGMHVKYLLNISHTNSVKLLIIFSGLGKDSNITYDFMSTFSNMNVSTLHIKDCFYGNCAYYFMYKDSLIVEDTIIKLINTVSKSLSLDYKQMGVLGGSKGASAALYYGIKYPFSLTISSAPQLKIGSFLAKGWKDILYNMSLRSDAIPFLDSILSILISKKSDTNGKFYIFTSKNDEYEYLDYSIFKNIPNLSFIDLNTKEVTQHNKITKTALPIIKTIISKWIKNENLSLDRYLQITQESQLLEFES